MLFRNLASQGLYIYAHDRANDVAKSGDADNITATISKDGAGSEPTNTEHPTEIGGGVYWYPLSQAETDGKILALIAVSSTEEIQIDPVIVLTQAGNAAGAVLATGNPSAGANTVTITVNDGTNPVENAKVKVSNGAESYRDTTNASGVVVFGLDNATWGVVITKPLHTFTLEDLIVGTDVEKTYSMTPLSIPPSDPGLVTGYLYCDTNGVAAAGIEVSIQQVAAAAATGYSHGAAWRTETSDADGLVSFTGLFPSAAYLLRRGSGGKLEKFTIPADAAGTLELGSVLGTP